MEPFPAPITNKEVEDFHRANPPFWYKPEEISPPSLDDEFDALVAGSIKPDNVTSQKTFLEATNPWLLRPDGDPEENMSTMGKVHLVSIKWVFRNAMNELIQSKGQIITDPIIIAGKSVDEYLELVKSNTENTENTEEYEHIKGVVDKLQDLMKTIQNEVRANSDVAGPNPSLLAQLEARQRRVSFSATKEEIQ